MITRETYKKVYESISNIQNNKEIELVLEEKVNGRELTKVYKVIHIETIDTTPIPIKNYSRFKFNNIIEALLLLKVDIEFIRIIFTKHEREHHFGINSVMKKIRKDLGEDIFTKVEQFIKG